MSQIQSTWVKTLYYDYGDNTNYHHDSLHVGPAEIAMRPDGKIFVLNMNSEQGHQDIYLVDSLGTILSNVGCGAWLTLQEWDSYGLKATPDSGCVFIQHYYDFGGATTFTLKKINKAGVESIIDTWTAPNEIFSVTPNYHNSFYCNLGNDSVLDYYTGLYYSGSITGDYIFSNDDHLSSGINFERIDMLGNIIWSIPSDGYHYIAASENIIYYLNDSLRKIDALTGNILWTRPTTIFDTYCFSPKSDGLGAMSGRTIVSIDSSGFLINQNTINLTLHEPTIIASSSDGSIYTGGNIRTRSRYASVDGRSGIIIKLDENCRGTIDSTDFYLVGDAHHNNQVNFVDDIAVIAAALGNSSGHPDINNFSHPGDIFYSPDWGSSFQSELNYKYSDVNLDGIIDTNDLKDLHVDIYSANLVPFNPDTNSISVPVYFRTRNTTLTTGDTLIVDVILGDSLHPVDSVYTFSFNYGLRFYTPAPEDSIECIIKDGVFGNLGTNMIYYEPQDYSIYNNSGAVLYRTNHQNIFLVGDTILELKMKLNGNLSSQLIPGCGVRLVTNGGYTIPVDLRTDTINFLSNSINQIKNEAPIIVYPSPASNYITVKSNSKSINFFSIKNIDGEIVYENKCEASLIKIDIEEFSAGVYFTESEIEGFIYRSKFLITH